MKNIINRNSKEELHGYQEWYNSKNKLELRGNFKNHEEIKYEEYHRNKETNFYIR